MSTLQDSAKLMLSKDYKERFVAEFIQLKVRFNRLQSMVNRWDAGQLDFTPTCPRAIYDSQLSYMKGYLECLEERAKLEEVVLPEVE